MLIVDEQLKSRRNGRAAVWVSDDDAVLLRAIATAEDRTMQAVIGRAVRSYAASSAEYQAAQTTEARHDG